MSILRKLYYTMLIIWEVAPHLETKLSVDDFAIHDSLDGKDN